MRPLQAHAGKQPVTASTASARHMHTHAIASSEARKPKAAGRSAESTVHAASARHTQANSLHSASVTGFSTQAQRAEHARRGQRREESSLHAASAKHMHVHADTSHQLRHVMRKPTSASSEHASRKPWAEVRRAHSMQPLQSTPSK